MKFIKLLSAFTLTMISMASFAESTTNPMGPDKKCELMKRKQFDINNDTIAIIGAGVSGLSAAKTLVEKGVPANHITVIEKEKSAGGKVSGYKYRGKTYELGAQMIIPGLYSQIEQLRDEFGLTTRAIGRGVHLKLDGEPEEPLSPEDRPEFAQQLGKYLTMYATLWDQPNPTDEYHLLAPDGYKKIHPTLKKTWFQFIKDNNFEMINKAFMSLVAGSAYAYRASNPTEASHVVAALSPAFFAALVPSFFEAIKDKPLGKALARFYSFPTTNPDPRILIFNGGGYQELWKRLAAQLEAQGVQFKYRSAVRKIKRNQDEKVEIFFAGKADSRRLKTDHVFYTADLSYLPHLLDEMQECEMSAFGQIVHSDYRSYLYDVRGLTAVKGKSVSSGILPYINGIPDEEGQLHDVYGQPVLTVKPHVGSSVMIVYVHGKPEISDAQIRKNIKNTFSGMNAKAKFIAKKEWKYFPHAQYDMEELYRSLMTFQGRGGLWMSGEIFSFTATHAVYKNAEDFATMLTANQLGLDEQQ